MKYKRKQFNSPSTTSTPGTPSRKQILLHEPDTHVRYKPTISIKLHIQHNPARPLSRLTDYSPSIQIYPAAHSSSEQPQYTVINLHQTAPLSGRKRWQRRAQRLTCLRRSVVAAPARRITFVDAAAGAVLALRSTHVTAAHAARAGAFFETAVDGGGAALDECGRGGRGDGAEGQRGEEECDGLVAHVD